MKIPLSVISHLGIESLEARHLGMPARLHPFQKILMGVSIRNAIFLSRNIVVVNFFSFPPFPQIREEWPECEAIGRETTSIQEI